MWEFANLCQWIYIFGKAAKIDESLEIEDIETECLKPCSTLLSDIALALLKLVSQHRGLTFCDLDTPTKIIVLQQLTQWVMSQPALRERMEDSHDQTSWRIEPYGWDADDRTYYVLDDNRVYRLTEISEPLAGKPQKQKAYRTARRSGRRGRTSDTFSTEHCVAGESLESDSPQAKSNLGGMGWECVAVTLDDVRRLVDSFRTTPDANEKILRNQLDVHLLPILEKQEESRKRKDAQHQRELLSLAKMANAKRSSRIAGKVEQQREEEKAKEQWAKSQRELESRQRETQTQIKSERERDFRMFSRERRLKDRAARRHLREEELSQISKGNSVVPDGRARTSDRQLQSEIDRKKRALRALEDEEEDWTFDCVCGLYGQVDDGAHSIACERCNVWQHSDCVGIQEAEADREDFQFVCESCKLQIDNRVTTRKIVIKLKARSSTEWIDLPSDGRPVEVNSRPAIHSTNLNALVNKTEVSNGKSGSQPATVQPSTGLKASSGTAARLFSDGNSAAETLFEPRFTLTVATSEGSNERGTGDKSALKPEHMTEVAINVASAFALPLATKPLLQASSFSGNISDSAGMGSAVSSGTLATHPTATQQAHIDGVNQRHPARPALDRPTRVPRDYTLVEDQMHAHREFVLPSQLRNDESKKDVHTYALAPSVRVNQHELPMSPSE
ncbi:PHD finger domain protein [Cordyceps militaris CM01]|uniref:PHD finger domain protein n=1 Tax=Cordyceps militaris (strain CM01) TaxID=983644 RepID=G3JN78_CORMM|nr:PHD finger domain protein [Cordyceps militaris CM01]EGX90260.1 PHD finger domain protein [Cordyceps militaris CM01]